MTVQELIDYLSELPRDLEVIVGSDEEGNDFISPYRPTVSWCLEDEACRCGFSPVAEEDIDVEYYLGELVQKVVM